MKENGGDGVKAWEEKGGRGGLAWLRHQLTWNENFISVKVVLFLFQGGAFAYLPYLTLHMQQLGITVKEIGVIYAFLPIASLLGPPISGLIADRFGHYKRVLCFNVLGTSLFFLALIIVPVQPSNSLTFDCGPHGHKMSWADCHPCHNTAETINDLQLNMMNCRYQCDSATENFTMCFHDLHQLHCRTIPLSDQITINGTLTSWRREEEGREVGRDAEDDDTPSCGYHWYQILLQDRSYDNLTCPSECRVECEVENFPPCLHPDDPSASTNTFWIYFALRMSATIFLASSFTMVDATVLAMVKQYKSDFGKQKVMGIIGQATTPLLSGLLIDWHSSSLGFSDYGLALYLGAALGVLAAIIATRLQVKVDVSGQHVIQDLKKLVTNVDVDLFLVMILVMGSNWGFLESYLFLYLKKLNAPNYLLGLTQTVGCMVGVPVMCMADAVINKLGRPAIFIISFLCYSARHIGYAFLTDPWMVFPFELLEVFTYQIMWVAACTLCPILAPKGLLATMTGLAGTVHYAIGRGVGTLLGGYLIAAYGLSATFRIFAYISLASGLTYTCLHFCYLKKRLEAKEMAMEAKEGESVGEEEEPMVEVKG